ncbi:formin-like protein 14 [Phocoena sinus]|uniref:formin-like protein 14 n=1 Tax=Phocoena sinus TaxID=42100 RepID=UPI0013C508B0|nr:formin-like protein 14 [Phocoena sinus]
MARASAAPAAPSPILPHPPTRAHPPTPRRAPLIGCPPTPPPPPPFAPAGARRTEPALRPSLLAPLRLGHRRRAAAPGAPGKLRESRRPERPPAPGPPWLAWEPRGRDGCTSGAGFEFGEWRGTRSSGPRGLLQPLAGAPGGSNPGKGKQMHGTSAKLDENPSSTRAGNRLCKRYYVMESREARDASSEAAGELIKCFKWSSLCRGATLREGANGKWT